MDIEPRDGHWHFRLGPVERWIIGVGALGAVAIVVWAWQTVAERLEKLGTSTQQLVTTQAVTNARLDTLSSQLSDVPGLTRQLAEMQVQVQRNAQDIHELQQTRRLR